MTDNLDPPIRRDFDTKSNALVPDGDAPLSEGFALKASPDGDPIFVFRYADYAHLVAEWDKPEHEKEAALKEFWILITRLATLGYGFHPIDDALARRKPPCGQEHKGQETAAPAKEDVL